MHDDAIDALLAQSIMYPETAITRFVDGMISCPGEIAIQIIDKHADSRRLGKGLMFKMIRQDRYAPTFFMDINADVKVLTSEIKFAKLIHGKSPFGVFFVCPD
jgi:hypothetical protein